MSGERPPRSPLLSAPALFAIAVSGGLIALYLALGGASYKPLEVADPCETRPLEQLEQRSTLEAVALSALDGAACELRVTREELTLALADPEARSEFAAEHGLDDERIEDAVRAGLARAVDDAAAAGELDDLEETVLREAAERAPIVPLLELLRAAPEGSVPELAERLDQLLELIPGQEGLPEGVPGVLEQLFGGG